SPATSDTASGELPFWIHDPVSAGVAGTKLYRSGKIELASATEKASVYYTVDGSDPKDANGTRILFTEPFSMDGESMTLNAVAEYKGNISDVAVLDFQLKKVDTDYSLAQNWNWISQITENPVAVADFATDGIESVRSLTQEVVRDPKHGFVGSLTELLPAAGYKVYVDSEAWNSKLSGIAFDPVSSVKLQKGWNWIGTPVDEGSLLIEDLFANLEVEEGDMLVGLEGFVQADAEGIWKGTVSHMVPGTGYMLYSNSDKEFVYNLVAAHDSETPAKAPVVAFDGYWTVDNHKYASVMPVIASLEVAGSVEDCQVAAFCGNECRGIGKVVDGLVMINVHGNVGDVISFRFMGSDNEEMLSTTTVAFDEKPEGTFTRPFAIASADATAVAEINAASFGVVYENGSFIIGGDLSDVKSVEIYDITGKIIAKSTGDRTLNVGNIDGSVVTVVIRKSDSISTVKVIVK
ncbi:MAG: chitobiase/beta-hexosaminidase C-terminal domain-containing protein, partial [Muribaculaceae bacterium]|nr:chitobiase/beta-hexosaminidase C-terminal domain-containing protein [Muribaculaceae bacterium]